MSDDSLPATLPTFGSWLSKLLGFQIPTIPLPQTAKNLDHALGRLLIAGSENIASRLDRGTLLRKSRAEAEAAVVKAAGHYAGERVGDENSITTRALEYAFSESILKQQNRENIVKKALEDLSAKSGETSADAASEIDDDWLNIFSDLSSQKSNKDIQSLWGKILSGKIRNPSSFSIQSLQLLSSLDSTDANLIHDILAYVISGMFVYKSPLLGDLTRFITCEDLGVLSGTAGMIHKIYDTTAFSPQPDGKVTLPPFLLGGGVLLVARLAPRVVHIPCFNLTRFGAELLSLSASVERQMTYEQEFISYLKGCGATVQRAIGVGITLTGLSSMPLEDV